jgi:hypothetical protein
MDAPPLYLVVKQASTVSSPYDPVVEIEMIRSVLSPLMPMVIRSFIVGWFGH